MSPGKVLALGGDARTRVALSIYDYISFRMSDHTHNYGIVKSIRPRTNHVALPNHVWQQAGNVIIYGKMVMKPARHLGHSPPLSKTAIPAFPALISFTVSFSSQNILFPRKMLFKISNMQYKF